MFGREISRHSAFRANCAAMRPHLVEIHDLASCPQSLRDALTDFLAFTVNLGGAYDPAGPLLRRASRLLSGTSSMEAVNTEDIEISRDLVDRATELVAVCRR